MNNITLKDIHDIPSVEVAKEIKERLESILVDNRVQAIKISMQIKVIEEKIIELTK